MDRVDLVMLDVQTIIAIGVPDEAMYPRPRKSIDEVLVKR